MSGYDPIGGGASPYGTGPGQKFGIASDGGIEVIRGDDESALAAIRGARSGGRRDLSGMAGSWTESQMARALQAYLTMLGVGGSAGTGDVGAANKALQAIVAGGTNGKGVGGTLREYTGQMLNGLNFDQMDNKQISQILGLARGAAKFGGSEMANYQLDNSYTDLFDRGIQGSLAGTTDGNVTTTNKTGFGNFQALLQRYLGLK